MLYALKPDKINYQKTFKLNYYQGNFRLNNPLLKFNNRLSL